MPYITKKEREDLEYGSPIKTAGQLNYCITKMIKQYMEDKKLSYQVINDIVGALDGAKVEFQRRVVAPYEDKKIEENGDV
jgi:hypothetical protein